MPDHNSTPSVIDDDVELPQLTWAATIPRSRDHLDVEIIRIP